METIKSYTDISQSKKLAEILPLDSADMYWYLATKGNPKAMFNEKYHEYGDFELPCWSLAALMEIIRAKSFNEQNVFFMCKTEPYCVFCGSECQTKVHNEPVDACYEMVLKLHELNLL